MLQPAPRKITTSTAGLTYALLYRMNIGQWHSYYMFYLKKLRHLYLYFAFETPLVQIPLSSSKAWKVFSSSIRQLYPRHPLSRKMGGRHSRPVPYGEERKALWPPGIIKRLLRCPARNLANIPIMTSEHTVIQRFVKWGVESVVKNVQNK